MPNNKSSGRSRISPPDSLIIGIPAILKTIQHVAIAVGCPLELDSKTLLLKTPIGFVTEHGELKSDYAAHCREQQTCLHVPEKRSEK